MHVKLLPPTHPQFYFSACKLNPSSFAFIHKGAGKDTFQGQTTTEFHSSARLWGSAKKKKISMSLQQKIITEYSVKDTSSRVVFKETS